MRLQYSRSAASKSRKRWLSDHERVQAEAHTVIITNMEAVDDALDKQVVRGKI